MPDDGLRNGGGLLQCDYVRPAREDCEPAVRENGGKPPADSQRTDRILIAPQQQR